MSDEVEYETVLVEDDSGVVVITLNRPEKMNALNWRLGLELRHAIAVADARDDVRAIVVTGAGRAFCAGQDLSSGTDAFRGGDVEDREERRRVAKALRVEGPDYWDMNTPIIAAINGAAVGAGLTIPLQFDMRIAAEDAKLGFVFNRRGVLPELNAPFLLPRMIGVPRAFELLYTGRIFSGREAAECGVVNRAVPTDEVLPAAMEMARDIATNVAPVSGAVLKRLLYLGLEQTDIAAAQRRDHEAFGWVASQPDAMEGPAAFIQKRDPQWKLRKNSDFPAHLFE
jgi:enoyl-CoA hydratase/carnithine racemase